MSEPWKQTGETILSPSGDLVIGTTSAKSYLSARQTNRINTVFWAHWLDNTFKSIMGELAQTTDMGAIFTACPVFSN